MCWNNESGLVCTAQRAEFEMQALVFFYSYILEKEAPKGK